MTVSAPSAAAGGKRSPEVVGILLTLLSILLFSMMDVGAKYLAERHDPIQVVWARYISQCFWAFLLLAPHVPRLMRTNRLGLQVLRSIFMFGATFCFFSAVAVMPLAEAVAIFEIAPLLITGLAFVVLKEPVGPRRVVGVVIGFIGAMIIIRPGGEVFSWASLLPMGAALFYASYAIATRFLAQAESHWTSFLYTGLFGALAASLLVPFHWTTPTPADAALMSVFGVLGGLGHLCLILALQRASASVIAPFSYVGLVFGTLWGFLVFSELPDLWTVAGAAVIVGAGLYVWRRERVRRRV